MYIDTLFVVLFLFSAFVLFDWGRIWLYARKNGFIQLASIAKLSIPLRKTNANYAWRSEYLGYQAWTYFILVLAWSTAATFVCAALFLLYFHF